MQMILIVFMLCWPLYGYAQTASLGGSASSVASAGVVPAAPSVAVHTAAPETITLDLNVVQLILNDEHRNGVDWGAIVEDFHTAVLHKESDPLWSQKRYRLSFGTLSQDDYSVLLDALDTVGKMEQLPQPPVELVLGVPASVLFEKQGMRLEMVLEHSNSGGLALSLRPHVSVMTTSLAHGRSFPQAVMLQTSTNLNIQDNLTVVIGGLIQEEEITKAHKIPFLGDIPLFGLVFRSQGHLVQKTETVIFLTVHTHAVETPQENNAT